MNDLRRPLPLLLLAVAIVGWIVAIWALSSKSAMERDLRAELAGVEAARSQLSADLQAQREAAGELGELQSAISTAQSELASASKARDTATEELAQLQSTLNERQQAADAAAAQLSQTQAQAADAEARQASAEEELVAIQSQTAERSAELADVGARLETARQEEAKIRETVAQLSEEASALSEQAAAAEAQNQVAREAEASVQSGIVEAQSKLDQMQAQRTDLEQAIAALKAQNQQLTSDTGQAEAQRAVLQDQVTKLADTLSIRGDELATLEASIQEAQRRQEEITQAEAEGINGIYRTDKITAAFNSDGTFWMAQRDGRREIKGSFSLEDDILTLSDASGDVGGATFPMVCHVERLSDGIRLRTADNASCQVLAGITLTH